MGESMREYRKGNTVIRIADAYTLKDPEEIKRTLKRIAGRAQRSLSGRREFERSDKECAGSGLGDHHGGDFLYCRGADGGRRIAVTG